MENDINKNERLKLHVESRNNVISELQCAYAKYSYRNSCELGCLIIVIFIQFI